MIIRDGGAGVGGARSELGSLSLIEMSALIILGAAALSAALIAARGWRLQLTAWLLAHHVVVERPVLVLPGLSGAGLDVPRTLIAAGAVGLTAAVGIRGLQRRARLARRTRVVS